METILGKLVKIQHSPNIKDSEVYGQLQMESNGFVVDFVIEPDSGITDFFKKTEVGDYYVMIGEVAEMDPELWETFERGYPWNRPEDILFVKEFYDARDVQEMFLF